MIEGVAARRGRESWRRRPATNIARDPTETRRGPRQPEHFPPGQTTLSLDPHGSCGSSCGCARSLGVVRRQPVKGRSAPSGLWIMNAGPLSTEQIDQFARDGFLLVRGLLDEDETALLATAARADERMQEAAMTVADRDGKSTQLSLWNHPGDDVYGAVARSRRVVDAMEQLLGGEVYHYHSKLSAKKPREGGAWEWHQDYGYWYENGCLSPDLASVMISIDASTRENGCLQVIRGSHLLGRVDHGRFGEQTGADPERVRVARERLETVHCETRPGDGLFFHSNLLHCSAANESEHARWALICCYNARSNDPYKEHHHPRYTPIDKLPDDAIRATGARASAAAQEFLRQEDDDTTG